LGHFGVDWNWRRPKQDWIRLSHLVRDLARLPGDFRLRLSSIEATEVTRELLNVMGEFSEKICPHLHICLQSGSDKILRRMNRRWGVKRFIDRCDLVRDILPNPAITTDVIVGFPGETANDFASTCDVARRCQFSKIHIFPFSSRRGTPAADMADQLSKQEKSDRVTALADVEHNLRRDYFCSLIGTRVRILLEADRTNGTLLGTSCRYAPSVLPSRSGVPGELREAKCIAVRNDGGPTGVYVLAEPSSRQVGSELTSRGHQLGHELD
jgi:threonylcarbamoyladenosine tRNA methylthiotransferase MtaB